jgi:anti-sigma regulatory factor (Ser/Thr protein kinase)
MGRAVRTGAAAGHPGYFHATAFYGSDREFLDLVAPFLADGVAAGEPTVAAFDPYNETLIREALGPDSGVRFLDGAAQYLRPAGALRQYQELVAGYAAEGAKQIRIAGDVPHAGKGGVPWDWWARYEATGNHAFAEFPLWALCPYDTRTASDAVLEDVRRTHPHIATAQGHTANAAFEDPHTFLAGLTTRTRGWRDPLERVSPVIELTGPSAARVRDAITALRPTTNLTDDDLHGLLVAATEAVSNAVVHGEPPVVVRLWSTPRRMVVAVSDTGFGPSDPFAGLLPVAGVETGGLGLWLAHQLCGLVAFDRSPDGFTIRLVAGELATS